MPQGRRLDAPHSRRAPRGFGPLSLVAIVLIFPDGTTGQVYFESRFVHPDGGETIEVCRSGDGWARRRSGRRTASSAGSARCS